MKKHLVALVALALPLAAAPFLAPAPNAVAAPATKATTKSVKRLPASKAPKNAPTRPSNFKNLPTRPAPASKGGRNTKDVTFLVQIDNRTSHYVDVFIDGDFRGTIEPWGDGYYTAIPGDTEIYCKDLNNGRVWRDTIYKKYGMRAFQLLP